MVYSLNGSNADALSGSVLHVSPNLGLKIFSPYGNIPEWRGGFAYTGNFIMSGAGNEKQELNKYEIHKTSFQ